MARIELESRLDFVEYEHRHDETTEIINIVSGSCRRQGHGSRLLGKVVEASTVAGKKLVWAVTRSRNLVAQQFYEFNGFRCVGVLRNYYKDHDGNDADAIMYGKDI